MNMRTASSMESTRFVRIGPTRATPISYRSWTHSSEPRRSRRAPVHSSELYSRRLWEPSGRVESDVTPATNTLSGTPPGGSRFRPGTLRWSVSSNFTPRRSSSASIVCPSNRPGVQRRAGCRPVRCNAVFDGPRRRRAGYFFRRRLSSRRSDFSIVGPSVLRRCLGTSTRLASITCKVIVSPGLRLMYAQSTCSCAPSLCVIIPPRLKVRSFLRNGLSAAQERRVASPLTTDVKIAERTCAPGRPAVARLLRFT